MVERLFSQIPLASEILAQRSFVFLKEQREKFPEGVIKDDRLEITFMSLHEIINDDLLQDLSQVRKLWFHSDWPIQLCQLDLGNDYHKKEEQSLSKLLARCAQLTHVWIRIKEHHFPQSLLKILASHSGDSLHTLSMTNFTWDNEESETHYLRHFPSLQFLKIEDDSMGPEQFKEILPMVPPGSNVRVSFKSGDVDGFEYSDFLNELVPYIPNFCSLKYTCYVQYASHNDLWRCEHVAHELAADHMKNFHTEELSLNLLVDSDRFDLSYFSLNKTEKAIRLEIQKIERLIEEAVIINAGLRGLSLPEMPSGFCDDKFELLAREFSSKLGSSTPERNERFSVLLNDFLGKLDELKRLTSPFGYVHQFLIE